MTAEVAILNRSAVALAADSAVTVQNLSSAKVYNTVNKLFTLSKYHPVGVMIFGNADYMGIPWETVVKMYREKLGSRELDTIAAYGADFISYVEDYFEHNEEDGRRRVFQIWNSHFEMINRHVRNTLLTEATQKTLTRADAQFIFLRTLRERIGELKKLPTYEPFLNVDHSDVADRFSTEFEDAKRINFRGRPFTGAIERALREYGALALTKNEFDHASSGVVIAGFGKTQLFPAMFRMASQGIVLGVPKYFVHENVIISRKETESTHIGAFAQGEMVVRFMEGVDATYSEYLSLGIRQLMQRVSDELIEKYSSGTPQQKKQRAGRVKVTVNKMVDDFLESAMQVRARIFIKPVVEVVSILPKEELAELAGALVNLTSLKRRISMDAETVGGPIDVAVISKGDGFVWIRRKHYFSRELNPTFVSKYFQGERGGEEEHTC